MYDIYGSIFVSLLGFASVISLEVFVAGYVSVSFFTGPSFFPGGGAVVTAMSNYLNM